MLVSDEEFIRTWKEHGGASAVSKALGITLRGVYRRRAYIEKSRNIALSAINVNDGPKSLRIIAEHSSRTDLEIKDGHVIVFSDAHFWPDECTPAFRGLLKLIKDIKPRAVICNGDAFDGASISRFPRMGWEKRPNVKEELDAVSAALSQVEDAARSARFIWPLGNHDSRYELRLANTAPEYEGVPGFTLKEHFKPWIPCWALWINNNVIIKHRWKGGQFAGFNNTLRSGANIVTGHDHALEVVSYTDLNGTRFGVRTGTLSDTHGSKFEGYMELNPRNWISGFAIFTFHQGRMLWPQLAAVVDENHIQFERKVIHV
jgi:hypothetical protein